MKIDTRIEIADMQTPLVTFRKYIDLPFLPDLHMEAKFIRDDGHWWNKFGKVNGRAFDLRTGKVFMKVRITVNNTARPGEAFPHDHAIERVAEIVPHLARDHWREERKLRSKHIRDESLIAVLDAIEAYEPDVPGVVSWGDYQIDGRWNCPFARDGHPHNMPDFEACAHPGANTLKCAEETCPLCRDQILIRMRHRNHWTHKGERGYTE